MKALMQSVGTEPTPDRVCTHTTTTVAATYYSGQQRWLYSHVEQMTSHVRSRFYFSPAAGKIQHEDGIFLAEYVAKWLTTTGLQ